jgi:hypothetical protein
MAAGKAACGTSIPAVGCRNGCEGTSGQAKCQANAAGPRATPRSQRLCGLWLGSPQPKGLKPFVVFASPFDSFAPAHFSFQAAHALSIRRPLCQPYSRRVDATSLPGSCGTLRGAISSLSSAHPPGCLVRPPDCFAGYDAAPAARRCGVARSGETAAGIDSLAPARLALTGLPTANLPKQLPQPRIAQHSRLQPSLWAEARRSMPKA